MMTKYLKKWIVKGIVFSFLLASTGFAAHLTNTTSLSQKSKENTSKILRSNMPTEGQTIILEKEVDALYGVFGHDLSKKEIEKALR